VERCPFVVQQIDGHDNSFNEARKITKMPPAPFGAEERPVMHNGL
jgi:hypothetical protein